MCICNEVLLCLKDDLEKLCSENDNMDCRLFATQEDKSLASDNVVCTSYIIVLLAELLLK